MIFRLVPVPLQQMQGKTNQENTWESSGCFPVHPGLFLLLKAEKKIHEKTLKTQNTSETVTSIWFWEGPTMLSPRHPMHFHVCDLRSHEDTSVATMMSVLIKSQCSLTKVRLEREDHTLELFPVMLWTYPIQKERKHTEYSALSLNKPCLPDLGQK